MTASEIYQADTLAGRPTCWRYATFKAIPPHLRDDLQDGYVKMWDDITEYQASHHR